jgi:sugar phosphate isomerase/epimerase
MSRPQIALQLYTLREHARTPADFLRMLERVRDIGYSAVEFAGLPDLPIAELTAATKSLGLTVCATHVGLESIVNETAGVAQRAHSLGTRHVVCPFPSGVDLSDVDQVDRMIQQLGEAGSRLQQAGLRLAYHNHAMEFHRMAGSTVLERIFARSRPGHLGAELDIHWVQAGGGDPVAWCRRLAGRLPILHVKDFTVSAKGERECAEVGAGNLDISAILNAAEQSGCEWFVVEQDTCQRDPFECVAQSLAYLTSLEKHTPPCQDP